MKVGIGKEGDDLNISIKERGSEVTQVVEIVDSTGEQITDFNFPSKGELAGDTTFVRKFFSSIGAVTDSIVWSPAAGKRWYITDIFINVSETATVILEDDLAAGDSVVWQAEFAANSGWTHSFRTPLFSGEDASDLIITTSAGNVYVMITGYEI